MTHLPTEDVAVRFASGMRQTPQSPRWHAEGDVLTHTRMVVDALDDVPGFNVLSERGRSILRAAAWLHDIGKTTQTRIVGGEIEAPGHSTAGSRMARKELWLNHGLCGSADAIRTREAVALAVRYHSFPPHAIDSDDAQIRLHRIASDGMLAPDFSIRMLCMLGRTDMQGRVCDDRDEMLEHIALCEELAVEEECLDAPYPFPTAATRRAYLSGRDVWKAQALHDDTWGEVVLMSGLPGTGKDTWIRRNLPDMPMVSLDDIRREYRISPTDPQGFVANVAKERARECLRRHEPFVWNATNLTEATRRQLVDLFESYRARVRIVYLETDWQTLLRQNGSREAAVPVKVIESMLGKLVPPEAHEASRVDWITPDINV